MRLFLGQCGTHFFTPTYYTAAYFCTTVNANCVGKHWLNLQPDAHKHDLQNFSFTRIRAGMCSHHRRNFEGEGGGASNTLSTFFYLGVYFFKKGTLSEYKYFLIDYLGSVKTKLKERPAFKRTFPIILTRPFRKINFLIHMVDFAPSPILLAK